MLNELSLIVDSLERLGMAAPSRHPRINPMGKNRDLLVVSLDKNGMPLCVEMLSGEIASNLFRIEHGSKGSSFPGLNIPTPLRQLDHIPVAELTEAVEQLLTLGKNKNSSAVELAEAVRILCGMSKPRTFRENQANPEKQSNAEKQFQRSCLELVEELDRILPNDMRELKNFRTLLRVVHSTKLSLSSFSEALAALLVNPSRDVDRRMVLLFQDILFGALDWKKRITRIGEPAYWHEKHKQDESANQPIYLDLASPDPGCPRIAHATTSALINEALFNVRPKDDANVADRKVFNADAFGESEVLQDKFPGGPKVAELGNVKLFSVNTNEVQALQRYRFHGSQSFPVSSALVQKMSDALLYIAGEDKRGITCRAIPSAQPDKRDLLVAYLENEPNERFALAEMFGGEASSFSGADFQTIAQPVLEMLNGKVATKPNLTIRLMAFCPIDKAKKQVSLNRCLRVQDVILAVKNWDVGAQNTPDVSIWFYDKNSKQPVFRAHTTPCPLEMASVVNRVWISDAKSGFSSSNQRILSVADSYDVFLNDSPLSHQKTQATLGTLVNRMGTVLVFLGAVKTTREWAKVSDTVRWQSLKAIALLGIILHQLGYYKKEYMQEPITQVGRLLALADNLHQQYCKHVRKGEMPSQLIGNALFNTALDQPVFALARLAERLTPYQAWARTFQSNDPEVGVGLVKYLLGEIATCSATIRVEDMTMRMSDADKAKLLLGYLADHPKKENPKKQTN